MTWTAAELIEIIIELDRKRRAKAASSDPAPEQPEFKPESVPPNETHEQMLKRRMRNDVDAGRSITMNEIARSVPKPRPPRKPSWG
jgi:hypothetical protein